MIVGTPGAGAGSGGLWKMLSSSIRWIQEQPQKSVTLTWLWSRRRSLVTLLTLLVVCIAIQALNRLQTRYYWYNTLQDFWVGNLSESSLAEKQDMGSPQTAGTADLHHQNPKSGKLSDGLSRSADKEFNGSNAYSKASCDPKSHIVFLKTHKTASSSIQNILYRYGESRNLTFALPLNKNHLFFYPSFFSANFVEGFSNTSKTAFDIMCNHMRFRKSEVTKVMPKDTFYFSILRDPVSMMESGFMYFRTLAVFSRRQTLGEFLDNCWNDPTSSVAKSGLAHNNMAYDFGLNHMVSAKNEDLEERAAEAISSIEQDFNLILISDYFDESVILLKHVLCWSLEDVACFRVNSRNEEARSPVSEDTAEKIKRWNALDWRLYQHFNATFWHKVDSLVGTEEMNREVSQLRELQAKLASTCLKEGHAVDPSQIKDDEFKPFQPGTAVIQGFNINPDLDEQTSTKCRRFVAPAKWYIPHLYDKQFLNN